MSLCRRHTSLAKPLHLPKATSFCVRKRNEVDSKLSNGVLALLVTELCPADINTKNKGLLTKSFVFWPYYPILNHTYVTVIAEDLSPAISLFSCVLIMSNTTATNFIHSEKLIEEFEYFPNKTHKACFVTVARTF